jgi:anaphase-promoting complex subunit 2
MTIRTPASMAGRKRVFDSVFPSSRLKDLAPTPAATPVLGQTELGQSFGGPAFSPISYSPSEASDLYPEQVVWDRAWHSATSFLALPQRDFVERRQQQDLDAFTTHYNKASKTVKGSFRYVASKLQEQRAREKKADHENILEWYTDHVRGHFLSYSKPSLSRVSST